MKVLIVAPAWVGDMVMAHTLVQQLANQHGADLELHMLAPPATAPLAERMAQVAQTHRFDLAHGELGLGKRRAVARQLLAQQFDQAIVLPNSLKSALVPFWAKIKTRTGWLGEFRYGLLNNSRKLDPDRYPLMIERFMALALPDGAPLTKPYPQPRLQHDAERARALCAQHQMATERAVLALCPGAEFGPAKRWPEAHFAAVAAQALRAGHDVWLFGSAKDQPVAESIVTQLGDHRCFADAQPAAQTPGRLRREPAGEAAQQVVNLAGQTSLLDAVDLLACADAVVCNDSGLMHVAAALGRRVVAVYGSTSPDFTPPLSDKAQVLQHPLPCSPCFQRTCPLGHLNCLRELDPERVSAALAL